MSHVEDLAGFQIHDHGHVSVPFSHGELIDSDVTNPCELSFFETPTQVLFENAFNHIPSYSKESGHSFNGSDSAQLNDETLEGSQAAAFAVGKVNGLPQHSHATSAVLFMSMENDLLRFPSNGQSMEHPGEPPGLSQVMPAGTAPTADAFCVSEPHMVEHRPLTVFCAPVLVVFQAHGVVKIACRRHDRSPLVSVVLELRTRYRLGGDFSITYSKSLPCPLYSTSLCTPAFAG
jgi:hypothetical protein